MSTNAQQQILDYLKLVRSNPGLAGDPGLLAQLEAAGVGDVSSLFGATSVPIANHTIAARTVMLGASAVSERVAVDVAWPCVVVGMYPSLSILTTGGATTPTLNDIDVILDLNTQEYMTDANGNTTATSTATGGQPARDGNYVTLAAMATNNSQGGRLMRWVLSGREARIGVTYRWKQGAGVFKDAIVSTEFFVERIKESR